jgi:transposase InsO family protein
VQQSRRKFAQFSPVRPVWRRRSAPDRATRDQLRIAIVTWIERTYHRRRRQTALGRLTPIEYELIMTQTANQAA